MKHEPFDLKTMIADYLENGFLENIIDMFKYDKSLYAYIGDLMQDERIRVRLGVSALIETLQREDSVNVIQTIPSILPLLKNQNPMIRGDAAYLLGIIGQQDTIPFLHETMIDENTDVRIIAQEAIEEIQSKTQPV